MTEVTRCPKCYVCPLQPTGLCKHCDAAVLCQDCKGSGAAGEGLALWTMSCPYCDCSGRAKIYIVPLATLRFGVVKRKFKAWYVIGYYEDRSKAEAAHPEAEYKDSLLGIKFHK